MIIASKLFVHMCHLHLVHDFQVRKNVIGLPCILVTFNDTSVKYKRVSNAPTNC